MSFFLEFVHRLEYIISLIKSGLPSICGIILVTFAINLVCWSQKIPLYYLGILPRKIRGLFGIVCSPFIHADFNHLFFNSIPFFVLGAFLMSLGYLTFTLITLTLIIVGGFLVWLFGRPSLHIGASGVISGYFGFILGLAYLDRSLLSIILGLTTLYYFGSIFFGIFPTAEQVSWESHLLGFLTGVVLIILYLKYPTDFIMLQDYLTQL